VRFHLKLPVVFAVLVAFVTALWCPWAEASHACCREWSIPTTHALTDEQPAIDCCALNVAVLKQPVLRADASPILDLSDAPQVASPQILPDLAVLSGLALSHLEKTAYIPDQSSRHLELSVLLN